MLTEVCSYHDVNFRTEPCNVPRMLTYSHLLYFIFTHIFLRAGEGDGKNNEDKRIKKNVNVCVP
jgi:hypothetical protein